MFVIYKADVTNPNRPSTCDTQIRDGDYAYIRVLELGMWFRVSEGTLKPAPLQRGPSGRRVPSQISAVALTNGTNCCAAGSRNVYVPKPSNFRCNSERPLVRSARILPDDDPLAIADRVRRHG